jgi:hypothetical protein
MIQGEKSTSKTIRPRGSAKRECNQVISMPGSKDSFIHMSQYQVTMVSANHANTLLQ